MNKPIRNIDGALPQYIAFIETKINVSTDLSNKEQHLAKSIIEVLFQKINDFKDYKFNLNINHIDLILGRFDSLFTEKFQNYTLEEKENIKEFFKNLKFEDESEETQTIKQFLNKFINKIFKNPIDKLKKELSDFFKVKTDKIKNKIKNKVLNEKTLSFILKQLKLLFKNINKYLDKSLEFFVKIKDFLKNIINKILNNKFFKKILKFIEDISQKVENKLKLIEEKINNFENNLQNKIDNILTKIDNKINKIIKPLQSSLRHAVKALVKVYYGSPIGIIILAVASAISVFLIALRKNKNMMKITFNIFVLGTAYFLKGFAYALKGYFLTGLWIKKSILNIFSFFVRKLGPIWLKQIKYIIFPIIKAYFYLLTHVYLKIKVFIKIWGFFVKRMLFKNMEKLKDKFGSFLINFVDETIPYFTDIFIPRYLIIVPLLLNMLKIIKPYQKFIFKILIPFLILRFSVIGGVKTLFLYLIYNMFFSLPKLIGNWINSIWNFGKFLVKHWKIVLVFVAFFLPLSINLICRWIAKKIIENLPPIIKKTVSKLLYYLNYSIDKIKKFLGWTWLKIKNFFDVGDVNTYKAIKKKYENNKKILENIQKTIIKNKLKYNYIKNLEYNLVDYTYVKQSKEKLEKLLDFTKQCLNKIDNIIKILPNVFHKILYLKGNKNTFIKSFNKIDKIIKLYTNNNIKLSKTVLSSKIQYKFINNIIQKYQSSNKNKGKAYIFLKDELAEFAANYLKNNLYTGGTLIPSGMTKLTKKININDFLTKKEKNKKEQNTSIQQTYGMFGGMSQLVKKQQKTNNIEKHVKSFNDAKQQLLKLQKLTLFSEEFFNKNIKDISYTDIDQILINFTNTTIYYDENKQKEFLKEKEFNNIKSNKFSDQFNQFVYYDYSNVYDNLKLGSYNELYDNPKNLIFELFIEEISAIYEQFNKNKNKFIEKYGIKYKTLTKSLYTNRILL